MVRPQRTFARATARTICAPRLLAAAGEAEAGLVRIDANASCRRMPRCSSSSVAATRLLRPSATRHPGRRPDAPRARAAAPSRSPPETTSGCRAASRSHLIRSRFSSAAASSDARRHDSKMRRAVRTPCADTMSRNAGPGSGNSSPALRPALPCPMRSASTRTGRRPATAQAYAVAQPVSPPPMMTHARRVLAAKPGVIGSAGGGDVIDPRRDAVPSAHVIQDSNCKPAKGNAICFPSTGYRLD